MINIGHCYSIGGAGMKMVDELIKSQFNSDNYSVDVDCKENEYTLITMTLPIILNKLAITY